MRYKIPWLNHFIELVVVFIGITAAFALNSWWENHKQVQAERMYLSDFSQDLLSDAESLHAIIPANEAKLNRVGRFLWQDLQNNQWPVDSAAAILVETLSAQTFAPKNSTYESIKNSGNLGLLSDYRLRKELIAYYEIFSEVALKERVYFEWLNAFILPFINANMDVLKREIKTEPAIRNHVFKNLIAGYYVFLQQNLDMYKTVQTMNDSLKTRLSQAQK
ncbi:hypothetical protein KJ068_04785 [bacterium]|nr:MAG: hypothetical protein EDS67_19865 [candidate division KSB1 bacterium]MCE7945048.1 hypothetical protein [Chlorobi bacterium CHB1]MCL4704454.1 hypothetical protein [bacterium]MDL1876375.1 hypothetical protein [Cytophagia bacterium CHB2]MBC6952479.1 hypothetical protein [candidate division KSB1 bacterium]